jgi:anti-sigma B factor antagonist
MNGRWPLVAGAYYPVLWIGQTAVVTLPAEIDITIADQVREDLLSAVNQGAGLLIADLSDTTFCDSSGVSALARTFRRVQANGGEMRLVVTAPAVHRVLSLTGVDRLVAIYPSVTASLAAGREIRQSPSNAGGGCGGSPLTLVTMAAAMSRSFTLRCWDAARRMAKARAWVHFSRAMMIPSA